MAEFYPEVSAGLNSSFSRLYSLTVTGSLDPFDTHRALTDPPPEDPTAANTCIVLPVNPLLKGDPQLSGSRPRLGVFAGMKLKAYYPRK